MPKFTRTLHSWKTDSFVSNLKNEIKNLAAGSLPLAKSLTQGGYVDDTNLEVSVMQCTEDDHFIYVKTGIFFTEIVVCCGCGDEPMRQNAYCDMQITIDKITAETAFMVIHN